MFNRPFLMVFLFVILSAYIFACTEPPIIPNENVCARDISSPRISSMYHYEEIPNQVLFKKDTNGNSIISEDLSNVHQGEAGDCYFLAILLALAHSSPKKVENFVQVNGDGTYSGTFLGTLRGDRGVFPATVNGDLPMDDQGSIVNNWVEDIDDNAVSWAAIIEKLWAVVNDNSYSRINGLGDSTVDDTDIKNGMYAFMGEEPVSRDISTLSFAQLVEDYAQGPIVIGTSMSSGPLTADHAFAVIGINNKTQTLTIGDPEGGSTVLRFDVFTDSNVNQYLTIVTSTSLPTMH